VKPSERTPTYSIYVSTRRTDGANSPAASAAESAAAAVAAAAVRRIPESELTESILCNDETRSHVKYSASAYV